MCRWEVRTTRNPPKCIQAGFAFGIAIGVCQCATCLMILKSPKILLGKHPMPMFFSLFCLVFRGEQHKKSAVILLDRAFMCGKKLRFIIV